MCNRIIRIIHCFTTNKYCSSRSWRSPSLSLYVDYIYLCLQSSQLNQSRHSICRAVGLHFALEDNYVNAPLFGSTSTHPHISCCRYLRTNQLITLVIFPRQLINRIIIIHHCTTLGEIHMHCNVHSKESNSRRRRRRTAESSHKIMMNRHRNGRSRQTKSMLA